MSGADTDALDGVEGGDPKFREAVKLAIETQKISTSLMQRKLGIGYGRAAKIIDAQLEALHIDVSDMADALYYFPHREIGQVLHSMLDHAPIDEAVKKQAYEQIFEAVGALDISEL